MTTLIHVSLVISLALLTVSLILDRPERTDWPMTLLVHLIWPVTLVVVFVVARRHARRMPPCDGYRSGIVG